jgi:hypothetical protein
MTDLRFFVHWFLFLVFNLVAAFEHVLNATEWSSNLHQHKDLHTVGWCSSTAVLHCARCSMLQQPECV